MISRFGDVVGLFEFNWLVVWISFCVLEKYVGRHILNKIGYVSVQLWLVFFQLWVLVYQTWPNFLNLMKMKWQYCKWLKMFSFPKSLLKQSGLGSKISIKGAIGWTLNVTRYTLKDMLYTNGTGYYYFPSQSSGQSSTGPTRTKIEWGVMTNMSNLICVKSFFKCISKST